jgi:hypothetical protein
MAQFIAFNLPNVNFDRHYRCEFRSNEMRPDCLNELECTFHTSLLFTHQQPVTSHQASSKAATS